MSVYVPGRFDGIDRPSINTYENAISRLLTFRLEMDSDEKPLFFAILVVADVFWQTEKTVRRDLEREYRKIMACA